MKWIIKYDDGEYSAYVHVEGRKPKVEIIDNMLTIRIGQSTIKISCDPNWGFTLEKEK